LPFAPEFLCLRTVKNSHYPFLKNIAKVQKFGEWLATTRNIIAVPCYVRIFPWEDTIPEFSIHRVIGTCYFHLGKSLSHCCDIFFGFGEFG